MNNTAHFGIPQQGMISLYGFDHTAILYQSQCVVQQGEVHHVTVNPGKWICRCFDINVNVST